MTGRPGRIAVEAPARLHLGFLDLAGDLGRRYISLGLAVEGLSTRVVLTPAARDEVAGPEEERAARIVAALRGRWPGIPPARIEIEGAIPPHAGLGSGTQLALAIGTALARHGGLDPAPSVIAGALGRGGRSGIGVGAFEAGGLLLDAGKGPRTAVPPVVARLAFPAAWRVLLLLDPRGTGVHGADELRAFRTLERPPPATAGHLCRLVLARFLPAVLEEDLAIAGAALGELQRSVGDHFATAQGGRFTSPRVASALGSLEADGVPGVGQSSWGPTGFALVAADRAADLAAGLARRHPELAVRLTTGRNRGATVDAM